MKTLALKKNIHAAIDQIDNEQVLETVYKFLMESDKDGYGASWRSLNKDQREEILNAFEESEDESCLIDSRDLF